MFDYNLFEIENDDCGVYLKLKLENENVLNLEHKMLTENSIKGFAPVSYDVLDKEINYRYEITSKICLLTYFEKEISTAALVKILYNIVKVIENSKKYLIGSNQILLDIKYIYLDITSFDIRMICVPIKINRECDSIDIKLFLKDVIGGIILSKDDNAKYVVDLLNIVNSDRRISVKEVGNILEDILCKMRSVTKNEVLENNLFKKNECNLEVKEVKDIREVEIIKADVMEKPNKEKKNKLEKSDNKIKFNGFKNLFNSKNKLNNENKEEDESSDISISLLDNTEFMSEDKKREEVKGKLDEMIVKKKDNEIGETIFVRDMDVDNPYLINVNSGQIFLIDKYPCRIGKNEKFADIVVNENETVSRAHAQIVKEIDEFYVIDNNSKNHTYINDVIINSETKSKITHNDILIFSNEKFIFKEY